MRDTSGLSKDRPNIFMIVTNCVFAEKIEGKLLKYV